MQDELEDMNSDISVLMEEINEVKSNSRHNQDVIGKVLHCTKTCKDFKQLRVCMDRIEF